MELNLILFLGFILFSKENTCSDDEINVSLFQCEKIDDILYSNSLNLDSLKLSYLSSNPGIIEKNGYKLEIFKLNNENLQELTKLKLYIPEACMNKMETHEKIKLDKNNGIVILVSNMNEINRNNLAEIFFVIRHDNDDSEIKFMNSKNFDFSFCHEDPILLDLNVNIDDLKYGEQDQRPINIKRIIYARSLKIDLFDPNSEFLNDICFKFTNENNKDVTLDSRFEDYYQNIILCDENLGAHYIGFNYSTSDKILSYRCAYGFYKNVEEKESYIDKIDSKMKYLFSTSNIKVITCYKQILDIKNFLYNYGGIICVFTFFLQVILYIDYCCRGNNPLQKKLNILFDSADQKKREDEVPGLESNNIFNNIVKTEDKLRESNQKNEIVINYINNEEKQNNYKDKKEEEDEINVYRKNKKKKKLKNKLNPPNKKTKPPKRDNNEQLEKKYSLKEGEEKIRPNNRHKKNISVNSTEEKEETKSDKSRIYKIDDEEANELSYEKALRKDKRSFCQYYCFILKSGHIILNVFLRKDDYNLFSVKLGLLFMAFPINLTFNIFFYTSKNIKYTYIKGINDVTVVLKNLLYSVLSSIFSTIFLILLKLLCLTHNSIRKLRKIKNVSIARKKAISLLKCIKFRLLIYYILSYLFLLIFGYYVICFCAIFENIQIELIKSMLYSWVLYLIYPFIIYFINSIIRIISLKCRTKCLYRINHFLQYL